LRGSGSIEVEKEVEVGMTTGEEEVKIYGPLQWF
jgi:hypothetical protein